MTTTLEPKVPERPEFELLDPDTYNAIIEKIEDEWRKKYQSEEEEVQIKFTFVITDGEHAGHKMWVYATQSMFAGSSGLQASRLYQILSAINRREYSEEESGGLTAQDINDLEGKKLRLIVKQAPPNNKGQVWNKIESYLPSKENMTSEDKANEAVEDIPVVESDTDF